MNLTINTALLNETGNDTKVPFIAEYDIKRNRAILTSVEAQIQASIYLRGTAKTSVGSGYVVRNGAGSLDKSGLGAAMHENGIKMNFKPELVELLKRKFNVVA